MDAAVTLNPPRKVVQSHSGGGSLEGVALKVKMKTTLYYAAKSSRHTSQLLLPKRGVCLPLLESGLALGPALTSRMTQR